MVVGRIPEIQSLRFQEHSWELTSSSVPRILLKKKKKKKEMRSPQMKIMSGKENGCFK